MADDMFHWKYTRGESRYMEHRNHITTAVPHQCIALGTFQLLCRWDGILKKEGRGGREERDRGHEKERQKEK